MLLCEPSPLLLLAVSPHSSTGVRKSRQGGRRRCRSGSRAAAISRGCVSSHPLTGSHQVTVEGERQRRGRLDEARGPRESRDGSCSTTHHIIIAISGYMYIPLV